MILSEHHRLCIPSAGERVGRGGQNAYRQAPVVATDEVVEEKEFDLDILPLVIHAEGHKSRGQNRSREGGER